MDDVRNAGGPCCAHLTVKYVTEPVGNGAMRGWWECSDCHTKFIPEPLAELLRRLDAPNAVPSRTIECHRHTPSSEGEVHDGRLQVTEGIPQKAGNQSGSQTESDMPKMRTERRNEGGETARVANDKSLPMVQVRAVDAGRLDAPNDKNTQSLCSENEPIIAGRLDAPKVTHPEPCAECGSNITWHVASPIWNLVMRHGEPEPILCPIHFAQRAVKYGIESWRLIPDPTLYAPSDEIRAALEDVLRNDVKEIDGAHWEYPENELQSLLNALTPKVAELVAGRLDAPAGRFGELDVDAIAEKVAHEIWEEQPKAHGNLRCWPGTHTIAEKIKLYFKAALASPRPASQQEDES